MANVAKLKIAAGLTLGILAAGFAGYGLLRPAFAQNAAPPPLAAPAAGAPTAVPTGSPASALANPLGLEVMAIGPYGADDHEWWSPSGEKITFKRPVPFEKGMTGALRGRTVYEIAVHVADPAARSTDLHWDSAAVNSSGDWSFLFLAAPAGAATTSLRVEYARGPWRTARTNIPVGNSATMAMQGTPEHTISCVGPLEGTSGVNYVITDDWALGAFAPRRYIAVGKDGKETTTVGTMAVGSKFAMSLITFNNLKAADIQSVRCEVHPPDSWLQFDNISLDGNSTKPAVSSGTITIPPALEAMLKPAGNAGPTPPPAPPKGDLP